MKNVIVYGAGEFGSLISNIISYHSDLNIVAYGDDNTNKIGQFIGEIPILGDEDLVKFSQKNEVKYAISSIELSEIEFEAANRNEKKRKVVKVIIDRFII